MMLKQFAAFVCFASFISAACCFDYEYEKCIRLIGNSSITFSATKIGSTQEHSVTHDLEQRVIIRGTCATNNETLASMRITFNNSLEWDLIFDGSNNVTVDQIISFIPADIFNNDNFTKVNVDLDDVVKFLLSARNHSFECFAELKFFFAATNTTDGWNYTATQSISNLMVQAFDMDNTFSPPERCEQDSLSSVEPTTAEGTTAHHPTTEISTPHPTTEISTTPHPTTEISTTPHTTQISSSGTIVTEVTTSIITTPKPPVFPKVDPVVPKLFEWKDEKNVTCFRLVAGLQLVVEYKTNDSMAYTEPIYLTPDNTTINGTCSNGTTPAVMIITSHSDDFVLTISETKESDKKATTTLHLKVRLDNDTFPNALNPNTTVEFNTTVSAFELDSVKTYYFCNVMQGLPFGGSNTTLFANDVQLQAFGLDHGNFSGSGVECSLDPKPTPAPPAPPAPAGDNTYVVNGTTEVCIVLKGEITLDNITYISTSGLATKKFSIPAINGTNVVFHGNCNVTNSDNITEQQLAITFNHNWTLTLTFAKGKDSVTSGLGATSSKEYSLKDIQFVYYLAEEYFPNATETGKEVKVNASNIADFLKGSVGGGSYKCNAEVTASLSNGVELKTTNLQYKAFNTNNETSFGDNVSECPADDESNSIVPIAVGAALAGLVVIVLIAYLIGRRRSRRQGYESV